MYICRSTGTTTSTIRTSSSSHWSWSSTTRSTNQWTWTSTAGQESTPSSSSSTTTQRPLLRLTTWSSELFDYQISDEVMYDGMKYRCVAPHRSFPGAEPGVLTWAWWEPIQEGAEENSEE